MRGLTPRWAAIVGGSAVVAVAVVLALLENRLGHASQALLLVVPVVAAAVLGGRHPARFAAVLATLMFLLILPPAGSLRLRFADDVVALVVFMLVALTVGGLVAVRVDVLGQLERQRAALLRSVSHDLRTPLTAISAGISELQDDTMHGPEARRRMLSLVADEADRLDRLVGDLLSLARLEGGVAPRRRPVDVGELAQRCVRRIERRTPGAVIVVSVGPNRAVVRGDDTLLEQLLTNLLENGLRHSAPGDPVEVRVESWGGAVRLTVSDSGPGVAPEDVDAIFEPFRSGPTAGAGGLGLAICEAVARAHGGTIGVSESPRGGAAFTVVIPI